MSFNISRLSVYAIISSIEEDLRVTIGKYILPNSQMSDVLGPILHKKAFDRLTKDIYLQDKDNIDEQILFYTDFQDQIEVINKNKQYLPSDISKYYRGFTDKLTKLTPIRNRVSHSRPLQYDDFSITLDLANEFVKSNAYLWGNLENVLQKLKSEPSFVLGMQIPTFETCDLFCNHNLPLPDFDETGFIGRDKLVKDLKKLCYGPYPVITLVGEGGIGKTALALKVAYEIIDDQNTPFEAIVWTTTKTTQLTPNEIIKIENAISSSLGMFSKVAEELSGIINDNPLAEVIEYLKNFKILLILDNLETVIDERVRFFLENLPNGSKVIITTRIGLGAFEYPVKINPMDSNESIQLMRSLSSIRGIQYIQKISNDKLIHFSNKMKNNPGFIKWFVSTIQTGKRPEEILSNPDVFLDFCLSNVYEYLSNECKAILDSMIVINKQQSQAELSFINNYEAINLQRFIQQLLSTNMVIMHSIPCGSSFESKYEISDLAREYLLKHHPVSVENFKVIEKRKNQLVSINEQLFAEKRNSPYSIFNITMRSKSDLIIAKYLFDSLKASQELKFDVAEKYLNEAKKLAPEYYEVHRCEGWIRAKQGNISAAKECYEAAIELEPKSAQLRLFYSGLLMRDFNEVDEAIKHLTEASTLDPVSLEVKLELARANMYLRNFDKTKEVMDGIIISPNITTWIKKKYYDLLLQNYHRIAEYQHEKKDYYAALDSIELFQKIYIECPSSLNDSKIKFKLLKAQRTFNIIQQSILHNVTDQIAINRINSSVEWLECELENSTVPVDVSVKSHSMISANLYIGNIPIYYNRNDIVDLLRKYGTVINVLIPLDKLTNKSKGFCIVQMDNNCDIDAIIANLNKKQIGNRQIKVDKYIDNHRFA